MNERNMQLSPLRYSKPTLSDKPQKPFLPLIATLKRILFCRSLFFMVE